MIQNSNDSRLPVEMDNLEKIVQLVSQSATIYVLADSPRTGIFIADQISRKQDKGRLVLHNYDADGTMTEEQYNYVSCQRLKRVDLLFVYNPDGVLTPRIRQDVARAFRLHVKVVFFNNNVIPLGTTTEGTYPARPPIIKIIATPGVNDKYCNDEELKKRLKEFGNDTSAIVLAHCANADLDGYHQVQLVDAIICIIDDNDMDEWKRFLEYLRDEIGISAPIRPITIKEFKDPNRQINCAAMFADPENLNDDEQSIMPGDIVLIREPKGIENGQCRIGAYNVEDRCIGCCNVKNYDIGICIETHLINGVAADILIETAAVVNEELTTQIRTFKSASRLTKICSAHFGDLKVNLIGSMNRSPRDINNIRVALKCLGCQVSAPEDFDRAPHWHVHPSRINKTVINNLHLIEDKNIDEADITLCITDHTGYVGDDTSRELKYAVNHSKPIVMICGYFTGLDLSN